VIVFRTGTNLGLAQAARDLVTLFQVIHRDKRGEDPLCVGA